MNKEPSPNTCLSDYYSIKKMKVQPPLCQQRVCFCWVGQGQERRSGGVWCPQPAEDKLGQGITPGACSVRSKPRVADQKGNTPSAIRGFPSYAVRFGCSSLAL